MVRYPQHNCESGGRKCTPAPHPCSAPAPFPAQQLLWPGRGQDELLNVLGGQHSNCSLRKFSGSANTRHSSPTMTSGPRRSRETLGILEGRDFLSLPPPSSEPLLLDPKTIKNAVKNWESKLKVREGGCRITGSCGIIGRSHSLHSTLFFCPGIVFSLTHCIELSLIRVGKPLLTFSVLYALVLCLYIFIILRNVSFLIFLSAFIQSNV